MRYSILFFSFLLLALPAAAQTFVWDLGLVTRFDNREYHGSLEPSQTIFGARITPQIGIGWGSGNYIKVGANMMADFAGENFSFNDLGLVYYGYEQRNIKVFAGRFPREMMRGSYSHAFFSDSVLFYDNDLEGALFQFDDARHWFVEAGCDWNGEYDDYSREKFMLFTSASYRLGRVKIGSDMSMYHHAGTRLDDGVVDNLLFNPWVEGDLSGFFDIFTLRAGYLEALQNDRERIHKWINPRGWMAELRLQKAGFGLSNALYLGDDLMPYRDLYGAGLYQGEAFFHTAERIYNRLEVYWRPFWKHRDVDLLVGSTHHYDGRKWGWQQVVRLSITLSDRMFRR